MEYELGKAIEIMQQKLDAILAKLYPEETKEDKK